MQGLNWSLNGDKRRLNIDSSSRCNLSCPGCGRTYSVTAGTNGSIEDMPMEYFKALVRPENRINNLTYNFALSDPIYSGVILDQIEYLNTLDDRPTINFSTNASGRKPRWWIKFASLLGQRDRVEFAIDGLEDTNHIYRVNAKWDSIMLGAKTLREHWNPPHGGMMWRYVIFEHNYHQVSEAQKLAKELGFNRFRAIVGDKRTPAHMILKSKTWEEVEVDLSKV